MSARYFDPPTMLSSAASIMTDDASIDKNFQNGNVTPKMPKNLKPNEALAFYCAKTFEIQKEYYKQNIQVKQDKVQVLRDMSKKCEEGKFRCALM